MQSMNHWAADRSDLFTFATVASTMAEIPSLQSFIPWTCHPPHMYTYTRFELLGSLDFHAPDALYSYILILFWFFTDPSCIRYRLTVVWNCCGDTYTLILDIMAWFNANASCNKWRLSLYTFCFLKMAQRRRRMRIVYTLRNSNGTKDCNT